MSKFLADLKLFVHSLTTSDHYASYDPSRPSATSRGQEQPLTTEYPSYPHAAGQRTGSVAGYEQGSRSEQLNNATRRDGDIQMSEYDASAVPSAAVAWERIDNWTEQHYPELFDQLQYPATNNDLDELEHDLDCQLPPDVRESYLVHDGQERGGRPTGLFFGITLLDLESLSEEWAVWRNTAVRLNDLRAAATRAKTNSAAAAQARGGRQTTGPQPGNEWAERQQSVPADSVQPVYAHPAWIPLAKDFGGNNIAVDLAPGPRGHVGQVILFGRDFDTKFVIAESWGHFLDQFATDIESGNSFIDDDIEEAVFAYRLPTGRLTSYFSVLRSRVERQFRRSKPASDSTGRVSTPPTQKVPSVSLTSPAGSEASLNQATDVEETVIKLTPDPKAPADELHELSLSDSTPAPESMPTTVKEDAETSEAETPEVEPVETPSKDSKIEEKTKDQESEAEENDEEDENEAQSEEEEANQPKPSAKSGKKRKGGKRKN